MSLFRHSEYTFYVKINYDTHPPFLTDNLGENIEYCDRILLRCNEEIEDYGGDKQMIKVVRELKDKLLGKRSARAMPEYSLFLHYVCDDVIP